MLGVRRTDLLAPAALVLSQSCRIIIVTRLAALYLQYSITDFPKGAVGAVVETGPALLEQYLRSCYVFRMLLSVTFQRHF